MTHDVLLRDVIDGDLSIFYEQQLDAEANWMAAFTAKDPADKSAFAAHWTKIRGDAGITIKTILSHGNVAGYVATFERLGEREVSYWIDKEYWGRGIATVALSQFLQLIPHRPLAARVAHDNVASLRVLQKCGFAKCGEDKFFANARGEEIAEVILKLVQDDNAQSG